MLYTAVDHKPKRTRDLKRLSNIAGSPYVSVLVDHYDDDWSRLWWCRMDGQARVEHAGSTFDAGVEALRTKYEQYRDEPPSGPLIVVEASRWTGWTATDG